MNAVLIVTLALLLGSGHALANSTAEASDAEAMIAAGEARQVARNMAARLQQNRQDPQAHYWLARAELAQIDSASVFRKLSLARSGKKHLEQAVGQDPQLVPAREALARYYLEAPAIAGGSEDAARKQVELLMDLNPAAGYRVKASMAESERDYSAAVNFLRLALAADVWAWDQQYSVVTLAVHHQTDQVPALLDEAQANVQAHASEPAMLLPLIDYQRGKYAATTGNQLEPGRAALQRYLLHTPREGEPGHQWAAFRLAQVERQLGMPAAANARLLELESSTLPEDLAFALNDERRWNYAD